MQYIQLLQFSSDFGELQSQIISAWRGERRMRGGHTSSPSLSSFSLWRLVSPPPPLPPCSGYLLPPTPSEKGGKKKEINNVNGLFISDMAPPPPPPPPHCSIAHTASLLLMFFCLASPYLPASLQGSALARPTLFLLSRMEKK